MFSLGHRFIFLVSLFLLAGLPCSASLAVYAWRDDGSLNEITVARHGQGRFPDHLLLVTPGCAGTDWGPRRRKTRDAPAKIPNGLYPPKEASLS